MKFYYSFRERRFTLYLIKQCIVINFDFGVRKEMEIVWYQWCVTMWEIRVANNVGLQKLTASKRSSPKKKKKKKQKQKQKNKNKKNV